MALPRWGWLSEPAWIERVFSRCNPGRFGEAAPPHTRVVKFTGETVRTTPPANFGGGSNPACILIIESIRTTAGVNADNRGLLGLVVVNIFGLT